MVLGPLEGVRAVDLFAGSGALGIEALSRGASHVDFVESEPMARRALARNLSALGIGDRAKIWSFDLPGGLRFLKGALTSADLVFLDPPYGGPEAEGTLEALGDEASLGGGTRVIVEHHAKDRLPRRAGRLEWVQERHYGETTVTFYEIRTGSAPA